MTTRVRFLDHIDWPSLKGQRFELDILEDRVLVWRPLKGGQPLIVAQAVVPRHPANSQPVPDRAERSEGA